jgi:ATP phosphoribosyltransferase regulatory subunit
MGPSLSQKAVKFFDPDGHILVLRPDYTAPIARVVAKQMNKAKLPLKLFYIDSVFRKQVKGTHKDVEILQAGIELIGEKKPAADAEVIILCIETLLSLGFKDFGIDIGHVDFVKNLPEAKKNALISGDYLTYGKIPERGSIELVKKHKELANLYNALKANKYEKYVSFNKGLIKDMSYYTGIIFDCYVQGFGRLIGSGGRYDTLLGKFGYDCPAIGFSLNLNNILTCQGKNK